MRYKLLIMVFMCIASVIHVPSGYAEPLTREKIEKEIADKQGKQRENKRKISALEKEIAVYDDQIEAYAGKREASQKKVELQQNSFKSLLLRVYKNHYMVFLPQLFSSESLYQFFNRLQIIGILLKEEHSVLDNYLRAQEEVTESIRSIQRLKDKQRPLIAEAVKEVNALEKEMKDLYAKLEKINKKEGITVYSGSSGKGSFCFPSPGARLINNFGEWRGNHSHKGVDMPNYLGAPICAADSGVVVKIKSDPGGYGLSILVRHNNGMHTLYAHMYRSTVTVSVGDRVVKGQMIARVADNGRASCTHLHFEVHNKNGMAINPMPFLVG